MLKPLHNMSGKFQGCSAGVKAGRNDNKDTCWVQGQTKQLFIATFQAFFVVK